MPPEVKVRLSVEGTPEAIAAFRAVQTQAQTMGPAAARGLAPLSMALGGIRNLLGAIAPAVALGALATMGKQALDNAEKVGRLADELGTTVEHMSGLSVAATAADLDIDVLAQTMGVLAKNVDALKQGSPAAIATFQRVGLAAKDFPGQDTAEWYEVVAKRLSQIADGGAKTAFAMAAMGKSGRSALSMMKQISDWGGLAGSEAQAKMRGLFIDAALLEQLKALADSLKDVKLYAAGAATQFMAGFGPSAVQTLQALSGSADGASNAFRDLGEVFGWILQLIVPIANAIDITAMFLAKIGLVQAAYLKADVLMLQGRRGAARQWLNDLKDQLAIMDVEVRSRVDARNAALKGPKPLPSKTPSGGRSVDDEVNARSAAAADAALERRRRQIDEELKETQAGLKAQEEVAKRSYERGDSALDDYYAKRRETVEKGLDAELAALEKQWTLSQKIQDPAKRSAEQDRIGNDARAAATGADSQLLQIADEEITAIEGLSVAALESQKKLLEAQGKRHEAAMLDIAIETAAERKRLAQTGLAGDELAAAVQQYHDALMAAEEASIQLSEEGQAFESALGSWLGGGINQVKTLEDGVQSLVLSLAQAFQQLIAMKWALSAAKWLGFSGGGQVKGHAAGGYIQGPGTSTSDSIFALLSRGEYVVRASAVDRPGALAALERLNRHGEIPRTTLRAPVMDRREEFQRYAAGGLVNAQQSPLVSGKGIGGTIGIELPEGARLTNPEVYFESAAGQRQVLKVLAIHRRTARRIIG